VSDVLVDAIDSVVHATRAARKLRAVLGLERMLRAQLRRTWRHQQRDALDALTRRSHLFDQPVNRRLFQEAIDPDELEPVVTAVRPDGTLVAVIDVVSARAFESGARHALLDLGVDTAFNIDLPAATEFLAGRGAARVARIDDVTRRRLRNLLTTAAENNWTYAETARAIRGQFDGFSARSPLAHIRNRAELVAVTEIGDAYEHASWVVAQDLVAQGVVLEKAWLIVGDERVCPICTAAAGQSWIGHTETFINGFSGPLGHPGCRCTTIRRVRRPTPEEIDR